MEQKRTTFTKFTKRPTAAAAKTTTGAQSVGQEKESSEKPQVSEPLLGVKPSLYNGYPLVSTGLKDFDDIIGGGVGLGTILLIEEDKNTNYNRLLLKYFIRQGISSEQFNFVCSADPDAQNLLESLPRDYASSTDTRSTNQQQQETTTTKDETENNKDERALKIAWQYQKYLDKDEGNSNQNKPKTTVTYATPAPQTSATYCHDYNLSHNIQPELLQSQISQSKISTFINPHPTQPLSFQLLLHQISSFLSSSSSSSSSSSLCRITLSSLLSPFYFQNYSLPATQNQFLIFLHSLRGLIRSSSGSLPPRAVVCLSVPSFLLSGVFRARIQHVVDYVVHVQSFKGDLENEEQLVTVFKDYSGFVNIVKIPRLNSMKAYLPGSRMYVYKMKKQKLFIEGIHLPPELEDAVSDNNNNKTKKSGAAGATSTTSSSKAVQKKSKNSASAMLCAPKNKPNPIDF